MTALFNYGFRPFFLLAGLQAVVTMAIWLAVLHGMSWEMAWLAPIQWHAHEMIFGFVAAALAGFLLTAVASWTGQRGFAGPPLMVLVVDLVAPGGHLAGVVALVACVLHAWRLLRWRGWLTRDMPIAWVLHVAYAWIPIGLGLKGLWLLWQLQAGAGWLHALTVGAYATMILAVMTRAALGHTGRPLAAAKPIVAAYALVTLAAITRVFAPVVAPAMPQITWTVAGILWLAAFLLYCAVYAPILSRPRIDGRPG